MGIDAIAFGLGALLLLVGILGGGFEIREFKTPPIGRALRVIATMIGLFFILLGIGLRESFTPSKEEVAAKEIPKNELTSSDHENDSHKIRQISEVSAGQDRSRLLNEPCNQLIIESL